MTCVGWIVAMLYASSWSPSADGESLATHPQDGPHADVRIHIESTAVRFDIVMNLVFVDDIVTAPREMNDRLHPVEEPALESALIAYFKENNRVSIDGVDVSPSRHEFEVERPTEDLLPLFPLSGMRGLLRVRVQLTYPAEDAPKSVALHWAAYPDDLLAKVNDNVDMKLIIEARLKAEGESKIIRFTHDEPEYTWHGTGLTIEDRFLPIPTPLAESQWDVPLIPLVLMGAFLLFGWPWSRIAKGHAKKLWWRALPVVVVVSVVLALIPGDLGRVSIASPFDRGSTVPDDVAALAIFHPLHSNIYRAFDYSEQSDVYDSLARSVEGEFLDALYNQIYRSLIMQEEGGAVSQVEEVRPLESEVIARGQIGEREGFRVRARWQVKGSVYHWGHSHTRLQEYQADYSVVLTDGGWKIAGHDILEQFRVEIPFEEEPPLIDPDSDI